MTRIRMKTKCLRRRERVEMLKSILFVASPLFGFIGLMIVFAFWQEEIAPRIGRGSARFDDPDPDEEIQQEA